jgi:hypothetical protein
VDIVWGCKNGFGGVVLEDRQFGRAKVDLGVGMSPEN